MWILFSASTIIIEVAGFNYGGGGHNGITNCLHIFGNCLDYEPGTNDNNFLYFADNSPSGLTFDAEYEESLIPETKTMKLHENEKWVLHKLPLVEIKKTQKVRIIIKNTNI